MSKGRARLLFHSVRCIILLTSLSLFSCSRIGTGTAVLWTDTAEILIAAEMFNASQDRYLITVHYRENLAEALRNPGKGGDETPSLVIGKGLRTKDSIGKFRSLDNLFNGSPLSRSAFYPALLEGGKVGNRQILAPVSFNLLLILQGRNAAQTMSTGLEAPTPDPAILTMDEIRRQSALFTTAAAGAAKKIAFSPRWPDRDFLFQWAQLNGAGLTEKTGAGGFPLAWNPEGLNLAVSELRDYIAHFNTSVEEEDLFAFKYLHSPGYKNVENGNILFTAMSSAEYFLLSPVTRSRFSFRYFGDEEKLISEDDLRYAGIFRGSRGVFAAEQFLLWLFSREHQEAILERSRIQRISESAFGIGGGFSSLVDVTESVFPSYYSDLKGKAPPAAFVVPQAVMPANWTVMKEDLVLPWLDKAAGGSSAQTPSAEFSAALEDYLNRNPNLR